GAILASAEDPVDLFCRGIVAADGFGGFGGEPEFPAGICKTVWAAQCAQVDYRQSFLCHKIDDGDGVVDTVAVIRNVREFAVVGSDYLVRIRSRGDASDDR